jgi:hypothetical protein
MTEFDPEQFETELHTLRPSKPPEQVLERIRTRVQALPKTASLLTRPGSQTLRWAWAVRWLVPAAAVGVLALTLLSHHTTRQLQPAPNPALTLVKPALRADKVEIDRQMVADFDAVTELPSGQPVRFRCEQWMDKVRLRDSRAGLVIERTTPRVEIIPIRFETY